MMQQSASHREAPFYYRYIIFLFPLLLHFLFSYTPPAIPSKHRSAYTVFITHPSIKDIDNIAYLVRNKILNLPGATFIALYHSSNSESYREVTHHLKNKKDIAWSTRLISCSLSPSVVFSANDCSNHFVSIFDEADAIIFTGGPDIPSDLYNHNHSFLTNLTNPYRHYFEVSFLFHLLKRAAPDNIFPLVRKKPDVLILGICLGMQSMNVATGGTLHQDIPTEVFGHKSIETYINDPGVTVHRNYKKILYPFKGGSWITHFIEAKENSLLDFQNIDESRIPVISNHHQALDRVSDAFTVVATSPDKRVIEAIQHRYYRNVIGVQFHPEYSAVWKKIPSLDGMKVRDSMRFFHNSFWEMISSKIIE
jgi:putative glutamine amidotransferase